MITFPSLNRRGTPDGRQGLCPPLLILAPAVKRWGPLDSRVSVAKLFTAAPLLISFPALKRGGHPNCTLCVAMLASCWPLVIPFPAVKRWGPHTLGVS